MHDRVHGKGMRAYEKRVKTVLDFVVSDQCSIRNENTYCIRTGQTHRQTGRQEHTGTVYLVATFVFVPNGHFEKL